MILECFEYNMHFVAMMNVINRARRCNLEGKFEKHHIIPRCFYRKKGLEIDNSEANLVNLTHEEHRKVHQLAVLCAKEFMKGSLKWAACLMNRGEIPRGKDHPSYGKKHTAEENEKNRQAQLRRLEDPKERAKCAHPMFGSSNGMYGKKPHNFGKSMTEDQKIKISNTRKERNVAKGKNNPMYGKDAWAIACSRKTPEQIEATRKSKSEKMKEYHKRRREGGV